MKKALREISERLKLVDVVIYMLDARAIGSCINPELDKLIAAKDILYCFNKADIANAGVTKEWAKHFASQNKNVLELNSLKQNSGAKVLAEVNKIIAPKLERNKTRGINKTFRLMVVGIPNSGKSTLINTICKGKKTATGDRPGVTRAQQWVRAGQYLEILDTPGALYPKFLHQQIARHLAYIGSINPNILDYAELGMHFLQRLGVLSDRQTDIVKNLSERYGINLGSQSEESLLYDALGAIAKKRGAMLRGQPDLEKAAVFLLNDFRSGRLGQISLDIVGEELPTDEALDI